MSEGAGFKEHHERGLAFMRLGNHLAEAEAAFRAALAFEPGNPDALGQLGVCLRAQGRLDEALAAFGEAFDREPNSPFILAHMGTTFRRMGDLDRARAYYDRALGIDPDHLYARINRCLVHPADQWVSALADLEDLLGRLPDDHPNRPQFAQKADALRNILAVNRQLGVDSALPAPERAIALYQAGNRMVIEGDLDRALWCYAGAAELGADYRDPAYGVGDTVAVQMDRRQHEQRLSCKWLEGGLHFHEGQLGFCCVAHSVNKGWAMVGPFKGGRLPIDHILARRAQLMRDTAAGHDTPCLGCHQLETRAWPTTAALFNELIVNSYSVCNMKCVYCSLAIANFSAPPYSYLVQPLLDEMLAAGWLADGAMVSWGGGDPSVSKEFVACAQKLLAHGCNMNINTNAVLFVPIMEEALRRGRCHMQVSVDSGTPATFYRIKFNRDTEVISKGRPAFDAVWDNVARYAAAAPDRVVLKYIFTKDNVGDEDVDGFVARCGVAGIRQVTMTPELEEYSSNTVGAEVWRAMRRMVEVARGAGLAIRYNHINFPIDEAPSDGAIGVRTSAREPAT